MTSDNSSPGARVAAIRQRRGLSQDELAEASGVHVATIRNLEQHPGDVHPRASTLHALARALKVTTTGLMNPAQPEAPDPVPAEQWDDVRDALYRPGPDDGPASVSEVSGALAACMPALAANRYAEARAVLPALIRDARSLGDGGRRQQSRVYNMAAWLLVMTRQWDDAAAAARLARDAASDPADVLAAVNTTLWLLLRQGHLDGAARLAESTADDFEPSFRHTPVPVVAGWGKVMLYLNNARVRDNSPGAAEEALSCAYAAAHRTGREVALDRSTTRTFGPASVAMIEAENAAIRERPEDVLSVTSRIPRQGLVHAQSASRWRSRLDVARAHALLRHPQDAVRELDAIRQAAPEWLAQQRYARDIMAEVMPAVMRRRRTLPENVRVLADAVRLPL